MMLGLIFFLTVISPFSLTVNVSFNTLQPLGFGRQFLMRHVPFGDVSVSSLFRIMKFYCILLKNYNIRHGIKTTQSS